MIDLHCHLLPGVDDGSRSVEQSVTVLHTMAASGVTAVCLTPHLEASRCEKGVPRTYDAAFEALSAAAPPAVKLHRGVEMMLDRPLPSGAAANRALTLGGTRYILVEFTRMAAHNAVYNALGHIKGLGLIPVLAHPERYACCTPQAAAAWKSVGALLQVDANTLFMPRTRGERARALVGAGLADILAADNHGDDRALAAPYASLVEAGGGEQAELLMVQNPGAILANAGTEDVPPLALRTSLLSRLKQLLDPEG